MVPLFCVSNHLEVVSISLGRSFLDIPCPVDNRGPSVSVTLFRHRILSPTFEGVSGSTITTEQPYFLSVCQRFVSSRWDSEHGVDRFLVVVFSLKPLFRIGFGPPFLLPPPLLSQFTTGYLQHEHKRRVQVSSLVIM